ncbi:MAG: HAD-IIIC family phosphatase [Erysipelotrichales bacterium]|nr:HAD-IIIC family phosphatase [Erysipelotrichales bacterium]
MEVLDYPFDTEYIIKNKRKIKKELLDEDNYLEKRIAILGGSTTSEVKNMLELFLLNQGIKPTFYESEYNMYYEDALFSNPELDEFKPDIIYIHTTVRNIIEYPSLTDSEGEIDLKYNAFTTRFRSIWESLEKRFDAIIIQNNFDYPNIRLLGNKDVVDIHGRINFINRINNYFYEYARKDDKIYINDINYVSSCYGLDKWSNDFYWYMYKYAMEVPAIPYLAFNLAKIIKSLYGKNKKALALDLDNTLWGGVIGDDGVEGISVGPEVPSGQVYYYFQKYLADLKSLGVLLNIVSKNNEEVAIEGLNREGNFLHPDDFIKIKANWGAKNINIRDIAHEISIGADSFVFVDDNPAERKIVKDYIENIAVPNIGNPEDYIHVLDRNGYFETTILSQEDLKKNELYKENLKRQELESSFEDYDEYLKSLKMKAEIHSFKDVYLERISQLTNKSNQFNLTTKRYTLADIEAVKESDNYITLYGKLEDIFGDNGVVSVVIGEIKERDLHIDLWIMSCRVLKRDMEVAMMDSLVSIAKSRGIKNIYGYYYPTEKNKMVSDFYETQGFDLLLIDENNNKKYLLEVDTYNKRNKNIEVNENE